MARQIEAVIRTVSAYAERVIGGYYLNIDPDRAQLARYGLIGRRTAEPDRDGARRRAGHNRASVIP